MNYLIKINSDGSPRLVECPDKPRNENDDPLAYAASWMKYSDEYSKALDDEKAHIKFKDEEEVKILLLKPFLPIEIDDPRTFGIFKKGSVHNLPEGVSVSFEERCGCTYLNGPSKECVDAGGKNPYKCAKENLKLAILYKPQEMKRLSEEETVSKDEKVDKNCENDDCVLSGVCHYPNDGDCKIARLDFMKLLDAAFVAGRSKTSWDQFLKDHGLR